MAICLPIVVVIVLAGMDVATLVRTNQDVVEITHETARVIATNAASEDQCRQIATELAQKKNLSSPVVTIIPPPSPSQKRGTPITVSVTVPVDSNCTLFMHLFTSLSLDSSSTVCREIGDLP